LFQILFGVVVFGVFHGLFFLPAMLSIVGPAPYDTAKKMESTSKEADFGRDPTVASHANEAMENDKKVGEATDGPFVLNNVQQKKDEPVNGSVNGDVVNGDVVDGGIANGGIANDAAHANVTAHANEAAPKNGRISVVEVHL
jgi:hypothetical protein